jgi:DNA-binding GntR family transcriptional regulator
LAARRVENACEAGTGRREVTRHRVREELQRMILEGERKSGEKLVRQQLARQFGAAQSVVREALLELQAFGLAVSVDNRGVFVGALDAATLLGSFDVREAHECLAVRLCCKRTTRAETGSLREMAERTYALAREGSAAEAAIEAGCDLRFCGGDMSDLMGPWKSLLELSERGGEGA